MKVHRRGNSGVIEFANVAHTFEISAVNKLAFPGVLPLYNHTLWENEPFKIGKWKIVPNGETNNLPIELRDLMDENNLAEGIFKRQRGLLWGQGPALYKTEYVEGKRIKTFLNDPEIEAWLKSFDFEDYLQKAIVDYTHSEYHFTRIFLNTVFQ